MPSRSRYSFIFLLDFPETIIPVDIQAISNIEHALTERATKQPIKTTLRNLGKMERQFST